MRKIEVDDEVFAFLQANAEPLVDTVNDVLRRLLPMDGEAAHTGPVRPGPLSRRNAAFGDLFPYLNLELLKDGDTLVHEQKRKGVTYRATVLADGRLQVEGHPKPFTSVSPALRACVGSEINGWSNWRLERTGERLTVLRSRMQEMLGSAEHGRP